MELSSLCFQFSNAIKEKKHYRFVITFTLIELLHVCTLQLFLYMPQGCLIDADDILSNK